MKLSSPRFKAFSVSAGASFWFAIIILATGNASVELFAIFTITIFVVMQIISVKVSKALDVFAKYNTMFFLGITFVCIISLYGIFFKLLNIDLLRLKKSDTYWLNPEQLKQSSIFKQY